MQRHRPGLVPDDPVDCDTTLAEIQAGVLELFPNPPLTRDQVQLLKTDKVVSGREPTLGDLGVQATPLDEKFLSVFKDKQA